MPGHPTLGTAFVIQQEIVKTPVDSLTLNLPVGPIPVTFTYLLEDPDILWMRQPAPVFGATFAPESLAPVLGLDAAALDTRFPAQEVSTGLPFVVVPLQNLAALKQVKVDRDRCLTLLADAQAKALLVFSPETYQRRNDLSVRVFADYYGVPEGPGHRQRQRLSGGVSDAATVISVRTASTFVSSRAMPLAALPCFTSRQAMTPTASPCRSAAA